MYVYKSSQVNKFSCCSHLSSGAPIQRYHIPIVCQYFYRKVSIFVQYLYIAHYIVEVIDKLHMQGKTSE